MSTDNNITIIGNLTADPELRFIQSGEAVCNFTVAQTPRYLKDGEWVDGDPTFIRVNVWNDHAEYITGTLIKGDRVIVVGELQQRNWEDREGNQRQTFEIVKAEVGASLRFRQADIIRNSAPAEPTPEPTKVRPVKTAAKTVGIKRTATARR
jgi:single-strand DNA-binding protein